MNARDEKGYSDNPLLVSVGICAYNEENNIKHLLNSFLKQKTQKVSIDEIIIISDGSTDKTCEIIESFRGNNKIKLIEQNERCGKWAAINKFLELARSPLLALTSADIVLDDNAIEKLCEPFLYDGNLGITCSRPIPINTMTSFLGYAANLLCYLHHESSLIQPKFNELIAFRNIINKLPPTLVDEEYIALIIKNNNRSLRYIPDAIFYNKGPENIKDFFVQRRRIYCGHLLLKKINKYEVSTLSGARILKRLLTNLPYGFKGKVHWLIGTILLESAVRVTAKLDIFFKKNIFEYKWKIAESTKNLMGQADDAKRLLFISKETPKN